MTRMPTLFALCGLPFAGKSTLARALAAHTAASLVVLDAINHERGLGLAGWTISADDWRRTYAEAYRQISTHLAGGRSVIFDHANLTRAERDQVRAIGQRAGAQVQFLYVAVSEAVVRQRWRTNRQTGERYDVPDEMFELAMRAFQAPDGELDVLKIETFTRASG